MPPLASRIAQLSPEGALAVYARARELEAAGRSIIHLELGEPDFHPAPEVAAAARQALDQGRDRYCASTGLPELRAALAIYLARTRGLDYPASGMVVCSGCKLALFLTLMAVVEPGAEVLHPDPSFPIYASVTRALGGTPVAYPLLAANGFQPDLDQLERHCTPQTRVLILCSPNNPTGTVFDNAALEALAALARRQDLFVISDEIYARLVYDQPYRSIAALPGMRERTVVIDGFSKSFAMTGWRLGYAAAPPAVAAALDLLVMNSFTCASEFIQVAAVEALRDVGAHTQAMLEEYRRRRAFVVSELNGIAGFHCAAPDGAFYAWVNVAGTGLSTAEVQRRLLEDGGVACIAGAAFGRGGEAYLRLSFAGSPALVAQALDRIRLLAGSWSRSTQKVGGA